jgi:gliding motility-associated lipoprotein GldD
MVNYTVFLPKYKSMVKYLLYLFLIIALFVGCGNDYVPKPRGYFRIDFPQKNYKSSPEDKLPYSFEYPKYSYLQRASKENPFWINVVFPGMKAKVHLSYHLLDDNLRAYTDDCREMAYKHSVKADAIMEVPLLDIENKVYGMLYEIEGNAASNIQFYVTDSSRNFLRGALYFNVRPNKDSLAPVIDFVHKDIVNLIETLHWQE